MADPVLLAKTKAKVSTSMSPGTLVTWQTRTTVRITLKVILATVSISMHVSLSCSQSLGSSSRISYWFHVGSTQQFMTNLAGFKSHLWCITTWLVNWWRYVLRCLCARKVATTRISLDNMPVALSKLYLARSLTSQLKLILMLVLKALMICWMVRSVYRGLKTTWKRQERIFRNTGVKMSELLKLLIN